MNQYSVVEVRGKILIPLTGAVRERHYIFSNLIFSRLFLN